MSSFIKAPPEESLTHSLTYSSAKPEPATLQASQISLEQSKKDVNTLIVPAIHPYTHQIWSAHSKNSSSRLIKRRFSHALIRIQHIESHAQTEPAHFLFKHCLFLFLLCSFMVRPSLLRPRPIQPDNYPLCLPRHEYLCHSGNGILLRSLLVDLGSPSIRLLLFFLSRSLWSSRGRGCEASVERVHSPDNAELWYVGSRNLGSSEYLWAREEHQQPVNE